MSTASYKMTTPPVSVFQLTSTSGPQLTSRYSEDLFFLFQGAIVFVRLLCVETDLIVTFISIAFHAKPRFPHWSCCSLIDTHFNVHPVRRKMENWFTQMRIILFRSWLTFIRDPGLIRVRFIQAIVRRFSMPHYDPICCLLFLLILLVCFVRLRMTTNMLEFSGGLWSSRRFLPVPFNKVWYYISSLVGWDWPLSLAKLQRRATESKVYYFL